MAVTKSSLWKSGHEGAFIVYSVYFGNSQMKTKI